MRRAAAEVDAAREGPQAGLTRATFMRHHQRLPCHCAAVGVPLRSTARAAACRRATASGGTSPRAACAARRVSATNQRWSPASPRPRCRKVDADGPASPLEIAAQHLAAALTALAGTAAKVHGAGPDRSPMRVARPRRTRRPRRRRTGCRGLGVRRRRCVMGSCASLRRRRGNARPSLGPRCPADACRKCSSCAIRTAGRPKLRA